MERKSMDSPEICRICRIGFSPYMTVLRLRDAKMKTEYETSLELTPCDFVALLLDPKGQEQLKSTSYPDLVRNCFHQCLTLFRNGVSDHVAETILSCNLVSLKDLDYKF